MDVVDRGDKVIALTAGSGYACALLANGSAQCRGNNEEGQLGDSSTGGNSPVPVDMVGPPIELP